MVATVYSNQLKPASPNVAAKRLLVPLSLVLSAVASFLIYSFVSDPSWRVLGAALISFAALLPSYLWCRGSVPGVPIFPLFALTFLWKYAYPLTIVHPLVASYSGEVAFEAGLVVSSSLLAGTLAWYCVARAVRAPYGPVLAMDGRRADPFFTVVICLAAFFVFGSVGQWFSMDFGIYSIVRAALSGLSSVGLFVLAYRWGAGELDATKKTVFVASFLLYLTAYSMTLFLIEVIVGTVAAISAYTFARGRVPWKFTLIMFGLFAVLHAGKGPMRTEYWGPEPKAVQVIDYPAFLAEWLDYGWNSTSSSDDEDEHGSLTTRMSLVHLLLQVLGESPEKRPYLFGETYAVVPAILMPRVLNPDKPNAHEGTTILSVHYGLQTREETEKSTIAWGPLNEAYANFGAVGAIGLSLLLGSLYGCIAKWATGVPTLSLRMLVAIVFTALALQVEWTAGVYVSAALQSLVVVTAMSFVLMERQRRPRRQSALGSPTARLGPAQRREITQISARGRRSKKL